MNIEVGLPLATAIIIATCCSKVDAGDIQQDGEVFDYTEEGK